VAYFRGLFSGNLPTAHPELEGSMMAVALSETEALKYTTKPTTGKVVVACINSPLSVTLSGDKTALEEVEVLLKANDVWYRTLKVKTAYHSHHMNFIADEYLKSIEDIQPIETDGSIRMFSSVTGKRALAADLGPSYWVANMLSPVQFSGAVSALLAPTDARSRRQKLPSVQTMVEVGPHSVLKGPLVQILAQSAEGYDNAVSYISVLQRGTDAYESAVVSAGKLWGAGHDLNLGHINSSDETANRHKVLTDLPPYPWNHERSHWHESRTNAFRRLHAKPRTDLLGGPVDGFDVLSSEHRWANILKPFEIPWVMDHVIQGLIVLPAAAMIAMALEACQQLVDTSKTVEGYEFRDVNFTRALLFATADQPQEVSMQFRPHILGTRASTYVWHKFNMNSITKDGAIDEHCNGLVRIKYVSKASEVEKGLEAEFELKNYKETYEKISAESEKEINVDQVYEDANFQGMQFGPTFRLLSDMKGGENVGCASLTIPDTASTMPGGFEYPLLLHPCVLDGIFQMLLSRAASSNDSAGSMSVISYVGNLFVSAEIPNEPGTVFRGYQSSEKIGHRDIFADIIIADQEFAKPYVVCKQLCTTVLTGENKAEQQQDMTTQLATRLTWKEDAAMLSQSSAELLGGVEVATETELLLNATLQDQAAGIYIQRALALLGPEQDSLVEQHPSIEWIRRNLKDTSFLEVESILTASAQGSQLGKAIQVIGTNLPSILDGSIDTHKLLLEQELGSYKTFTDALLCKEMINSKIAAWFDLAGDKNPEMQILEIGNGSISTAASVLETLASNNGRYSQYTFAVSDTSRLDEVKASLKEKKYPSVDVQTSDIERDLATQSVGLKKYDVIIINEMLPVVSNIDVALQNAKAILKPGGTLLITALSRLTTRTALVLGTAEKWWSARGDAPPQTRHLPGEAWAKLLVDNGLLSPEILLPDSQNAELQQMSLIITTSPKEAVLDSQHVVILEASEMSPSTAALSSNISGLLTIQGFTVVKATLTTMPDPAEKLFISLMDIDSPVLDGLTEEAFDNLKLLMTKSAGVLWTTRAGVKSAIPIPKQSSLIGLFRTVRSEAPHLRLFNLDLSPATDISLVSISNLVMKIFATSFSEDEIPVTENEYAESDGVLFIPRLVQEEAMNSSLTERNALPSPEQAPLFQPGRPLKMMMGELGLLDTMRFVDREEMMLPLAPNEVDIKILATGLNFVDIMTALGYIPSSSLGAEFAGVITEVGSEVPDSECRVGQIVVASTEYCIASNIRIDWRAAQLVPDGVTPEAAATCLIAYATAYFALYDNGRLKKTDTILIHYAAGGLGQAAIQLAQHIGATIYCTVGSIEKKTLIMEQYGIPENQIFNSRDMTFKQGLMRETKGRGVDVILNSTFGEMLRETWNCLADHGIMVEVGKRDILSNNSLEMAPFIRGCTFSALNLAQYTEKSEPHRLRNYQTVVKEVFKLLGEGIITPPYPLRVMKVTEAEEAFRALQSGKFSGKTVLTMDADAIVPVLPKKAEPLALDPEATYLLAGGLGGIGRSLAELLADHGAKNIVFVSRSGDASEQAKSTIEKLREREVNAVAYACDVTDRPGLELVLEKCRSEMPKIKGFLNCVMLVKV
jgi:NADPH:quinone reductase-like Zn-dependent oxidoreductase/malonyl CoA-acyl carrier protein transacylase